MCLVNALGVRSPADGLDDGRVKGHFLPRIDGGQAKGVVVCAGSVHHDEH